MRILPNLVLTILSYGTVNLLQLHHISPFFMHTITLLQVTSYFAFPIVMFLIYHKSEKLIQYYKGPDYVST